MISLKAFTKVFSAFCLTIFLSACATTATQDIKVEAQADPKVSFSGYKNYAWLASAEILYDPEGQWEPKNIDIDSEVRFIVNRELRKRGMVEVTSNPDMYIAFAAGVDMTSLDIKENPESKEQVLANIPKAGLVIVMVDADTGFPQDSGHGRHHTGPVDRSHAQIIGGLDVIHGGDRAVRQFLGLKREVWYPVFRVGGQGPRDINDIGNHGRGRRQGAGTCTVIQGRANRVTFDQYRVHHPVDIGEQAARRNQRWMHPELDAIVAPPRETGVTSGT